MYEGLPVVGVEAQATGLLCIFSDDMTKETKVLDTTEFLSLNQSVEEWTYTILKKYKSFKRKNCTNEISKKDFNIKKEAKKLIRKYYEEYRRKVTN